MSFCWILFSNAGENTVLAYATNLYVSDWCKILTSIRNFTYTFYLA